MIGLNVRFYAHCSKNICRKLYDITDYTYAFWVIARWNDNTDTREEQASQWQCKGQRNTIKIYKDLRTTKNYILFPKRSRYFFLWLTTYYIRLLLHLCACKVRGIFYFTSKDMLAEIKKISEDVNKKKLSSFLPLALHNARTINHTATCEV